MTVSMPKTALSYRTALDTGGILTFFMLIVLSVALIVNLLGLVLALPSSQSVFSMAPVIYLSLAGSAIIWKTRFMVLRHIRFETFYHLLRNANLGFKATLVAFGMFLFFAAVNFGGLLLPESINRIALILLTSLVWTTSFTYYTILFDSNTLAAACFLMAGNERNWDPKLRWVIAGVSQMARYFSKLGAPLKEATVNQLLIGKLSKTSSFNRAVNSLAGRLLAGASPILILNQLNSNHGVVLLELERRSQLRRWLRRLNDYAPLLSILVTLAALMFAILRH